MKDSMSDQQISVNPSNPAPSVPVKPQSSSLQDIQHESGEECTSLKTHECFDKEAASQGKLVGDCNGKKTGVQEEYGRERIKRHRIEVAGRVWIPDIWGQEELLKDWIDCSAFDACLVPNGIVSARASLVREGRRANSTGITIENSC
ncbi:hypothetical protein HS088_TW03G00844 [Tripterygium wilfordii]|uniref:Protein BIC1 n=1 Tax=Tripterygium wilfordii TaxID=458696 RepID=A0A7J7DW15_TRIWF|nr:uncharacterized protein LOC119995168 [Tripterygium wilfordii]KAF5750507.1 hypothetical protein HS088_TW03G00844 [Tripterygium wilfordii]